MDHGFLSVAGFGAALSRSSQARPMGQKRGEHFVLNQLGQATPSVAVILMSGAHEWQAVKARLWQACT